MTTVVNTPAPSDSGNGIGLILGIALILFLGFLFFVYGLPMMRSRVAPQVNVPDKIDVNVNQGQPGQPSQ